MRATRIALYGNFGAGNLGNECTLQAVIEQTRERLPDARLLCIASNPDDVRIRHGIEAFPAEAQGSRWWWASQERGETHEKSRWQRALARLVRVLFRRIPRELAHWVQALRVLRGTNMLVVAGTGIVADYMCGPLKWPYDMFKLTLLARLQRAQVVFLSVGAGPIRHPLSRVFIKCALGLAQYRSYRDEASRRYLQTIGFYSQRDKVYPDVVFGLPHRHLESPGHLEAHADRAARRLVVGLGLKDYGSTDDLEEGAFAEYLSTMTEFVRWLQASGHCVRLLIGDFQYDTPVTGQVVELLARRGAATSAPHLLVEPARSVEELLHQLGETDLVVSPRYHNLVMALLQNKPVMALSDHPKLDSLICDLGLERYRISLANLKVAELIDRFSELERQAVDLKPRIARNLAGFRGALDDQYAALYHGLTAHCARRGFANG